MTFVAALVLFLLAVAVMAVGLLRGRRLAGSCGGVDRQGKAIGECVCGKPSSEACNADPETLERIAEERRRERDRDPIGAR
ncbi:MAG: hypothetical protein R3F34_01065 [Planctomycetota bacterium]